MTILVDELRLSESSYVDPRGRLFFYQDRILRGVLPQAVPFVRKLLESNSFRKLQRDGKLVATSRTNIVLPGFDFVLEHERISFPSYPCEWCPGMLRDAGVLLLEILQEFIDEDIIIADGHPWNILFDGPRPVFVDVGSFEPSDEAIVWPAYQQFCNTFLHPVYVSAAGFRRVARMLNVDSLDGISTAECRALLPFTFKIRNPATWFRVVLPDLIENLNRRKDLSERLRGASRNLAATVDLRAARKRFVGKLLSEMTGLKLEPEKTPWSRYYEKDAPPEAQEKIDVISQILDRIRPATLFDAGCNTGLFGALASRKAIRTVAVDTDESCVSRLYATARAEGLDILPLVMSVVRYSPASGWMGIEYPSAPERLRCECVLALSLVHHLALGQLQDFERIIRSLGAFTDRYLIVEFVERGDPMAQMLLKRCRHPVDFYSMELFTEVLGRYYRTLEKAPAYSATRTLFVCEK